MEFEEIKNFFFDLDKTLWNWNSLIIGAEDAVETLRDAGKNVYFHTDNTLLTRREYAKKLTSMGIPAEKEDIITSSYVTAKHLEKEDVQEAYALGESGLIEDLEDHDIQVSEKADRIVAGLDRQFSYSKLKRAKKILDQGGKLYICSTENNFRISTNEQPHQGPTNKALTTFGEPTYTGKPSQIFRDHFQDYFSYFPKRSIFIGDRLADIETGNRLGMKTAAVMSGEIDREKLEKAEDMNTPDLGISSLAKLKRRII